MTGFALPLICVAFGGGFEEGVVMPRRPFKDDTDFFDFAHLPRGGGRGGRAEAPPSVLRARSASTVPVPGTTGNVPSTGLSRVTPGKNRALASAVADLNETASRLATKTRAYAPLLAGHKALVDRRRGSQAISEAVAKQSAQAATRAKSSPAQAIAADRRLFNPTPGPKTVFGTQANVKPSVAGRFRFAFPAIAHPCVVRKTRREVMFALHGGRGSHKPKRKGPYSSFSC